MIEQIETRPPDAGFEFRVRAHRSVTVRGVVGFFGLLAAFSLAVAAASWSQGNVFAPWFALAELGALGGCLALVWCRLGRLERIEVRGDGVTVALPPATRTFRFDLAWVRVERWPGRRAADLARLVLTSHGRAVEIGGSLAAPERGALEWQLRQALERVRDARPS
jgi:uncharacterized membrane protein